MIPQQNVVKTHSNRSSDPNRGLGKSKGQMPVATSKVKTPTAQINASLKQNRQIFGSAFTPVNSIDMHQLSSSPSFESSFKGSSKMHSNPQSSNVERFQSGPSSFSSAAGLDPSQKQDHSGNVL